jgi:hypothetical protein
MEASSSGISRGESLLDASVVVVAVVSVPMVMVVVCCFVGSGW